MLVNRVTNLDLTWRQEIDDLSNRPSPRLELNVDDLGLRRSIEQLTFLEMKRKSQLLFLAHSSITQPDPNRGLTILFYPPRTQRIMETFA